MTGPPPQEHPETTVLKRTLMETAPMPETATLKDWITETLRTQLAPTHLDVIDESHLHAGHSGARPEGETHFRLDVVSGAFEGKSRVERHRIVNAALDPAFKRGLHALAVKARTPAEAA